MKIMLVCVGGMSTGLLMKKIEKWFDENSIDGKVKAYGIGEFEDYISEYEYVLLGPQISYKEAEIRELTDKPLFVINAMDYATCNVEKIIKKIKGEE